MGWRSRREGWRRFCAALRSRLVSSRCSRQVSATDHASERTGRGARRWRRPSSARRECRATPHDGGSNRAASGLRRIARELRAVEPDASSRAGPSRQACPALSGPAPLADGLRARRPWSPDCPFARGRIAALSASHSGRPLRGRRGQDRGTKLARPAVFPFPPRRDGNDRAALRAPAGALQRAQQPCGVASAQLL